MSSKTISSSFQWSDVVSVCHTGVLSRTLFSLDNRVINSICVLISQDRVLGLHGVSTVSGTGVVSSPSANVTSAGLVSCAPRLSHTPPHDFHREVLASPMQPQAHQYYAPQYNPLHFPQQQQPRFDFTHPLEPAFPSQQFGNGPAGFHPSTGASHQSMAGPTHPQPVSQHQARHPLRGRPSEALQQAHINQFAGAAMEHARRREELYVRRPDHMFDIIAQGNIADAQVKRKNFALILVVTHCTVSPNSLQNTNFFASTGFALLSAICIRQRYDATTYKHAMAKLKREENFAENYRSKHDCFFEA